MSATTRIGGDRLHRHSLRVRTQQLPLGSRTAVAGFERFFEATEAADPERLMALIDDLVTRLESAYAVGGSLTDVVGDDPVTFAERFSREHPHGAWLTAERARLVAALDEARREEGED